MQGCSSCRNSCVCIQKLCNGMLWAHWCLTEEEVLSSELEQACHCPASIHFLLARGHSEVTLELCSKQKLESLLSQYDDILVWEEDPHSSDSSGKNGNIGPHLHSQSLSQTQIEQMKDSAISHTGSGSEQLSPSLLGLPCVWFFLISNQAFFFPILDKALVESQPASAWKDSRHLRRSWPREFWMA